MNRQGSFGGLATRFHLARPNVTQAEIDAVVAVLRTPNLSLGPQLAAFESAFASYCGTRHAVACSSGTAGLHMLMQAIGIQPGDEVITTPFSFVASANCILMEGGTPVFVDIDPKTWNLNPRRIEAAITPRTRAILPVHVFGLMAEMNPILTVAKLHDLTVIEDSCEALGSRYGGQMAGSMGRAGVFAFYPNKQITTGEGGMIVTDDDEIAGLGRSLRNQGRDSGDSWLQHTRLGYNYRLSEMNCALGAVQLGRIEEIIAERSRVAGLYRDHLSSESRLSVQAVEPAPTSEPNAMSALGQAETSWFVFVVRLDDRYDQNDRDRILRALNESGIQCGAYFPPIHLQPFYVERFGYKVGDFPVCEALAARTIALPFHHELTAEDIEWVCEQLCRML